MVLLKWQLKCDTHTHTHIYIYIYIKDTHSFYSINVSLIKMRGLDFCSSEQIWDLSWKCDILMYFWPFRYVPRETPRRSAIIFFHALLGTFQNFGQDRKWWSVSSFQCLIKVLNWSRRKELVFYTHDIIDRTYIIYM
jgi:hypothetical protein